MKILKTILKYVIIIIIIVVLIILYAILDIDPKIMNIITSVISLAMLALTVFIIGSVIGITLKQSKHLDEMMIETLNNTLGDENSSVNGKIYAYILRFDKNPEPFPCFLGFTHSCLLMIMLDQTLIPVQAFAFPLDEIKSCKIKKSLIPGQHILSVSFENFFIKIKIYNKVKGMENQETNSQYFLDKFSRYIKY